MASFDIVSKVDLQKIDNAVNVAKKELINRYDLKDEQCDFVLDKKNNTIKLEAKQNMAIESMEGILLSKFSKQGLDVRSLDLTKDIVPSGKLVYKELRIKEGLEKEAAKKIVSFLKETKLKVQASIMDDQIRVTSKSIDELQETMSKLRGEDFEIPLQFDNMRS